MTHNNPLGDKKSHKLITRKGWLMTRHFWVLLHRYAGLTMAVFLIIAGLTGSILAFYPELDRLLNPEEYFIQLQDKPLLDPFELRERALKLEPHSQVNIVPLTTKPGEVYAVVLEPKIDLNSGHSNQLRSLKLNPYTGERIPGQVHDFAHYQETGYWPLNRKNILFFIYALHYSLALGEVGTWIFGIAATIWTLDCFVGFYLTLPMRRKSPLSLWERAVVMARDRQMILASPLPNPFMPQRVLPKGEGTSSFWQRWQVAWKIKWPSSTQRLNFDLHRAGGLWMWPMLLVFAWSSVMFNLHEQFYQPVMNQLFGAIDIGIPSPLAPENPVYEPIIDFRSAYHIGQRLMVEQAKINRFNVLKEESIQYDPTLKQYTYVVVSDHDNCDIEKCFFLVTHLTFIAVTGKFLYLYLPGIKARDSIEHWLVYLHMAKIWGLPYKIFICVMGLVITMLSVTGVYIWWKKRLATKAMQKKTTSAENIPRLNN
ncbi:PepSY-associated TM helix domain-containing protein [Methyloglobulus sp.]|uniref:PepSY-associated TM helix domain-containing protein n=1 Tax=Methyloglobulus sp. TaxID=2518622 RepID=UPI0032B79277